MLQAKSPGLPNRNSPTANNPCQKRYRLHIPWCNCPKPSPRACHARRTRPQRQNSDILPPPRNPHGKSPNIRYFEIPPWISPKRKGHQKPRYKHARKPNPKRSHQRRSTNGDDSDTTGKPTTRASQMHPSPPSDPQSLTTVPP